MATCRKFLCLAKKQRFFLYSSQKYYSTSAEANVESGKSDEIVVPYRIHRGPTDILKALASTISKDYTAPHYKYEDDPYFIPASNITKRAFALSKESGRKAARYFLEKYPDLFLCNKSVPHIKAFDPPTVYTKENVTSPDQLLECIENFDMNKSITVYKILKEKGVVISQEIKQDLLELLSFYNEVPPPDEDYYEERYFMKRDQRRNPQEKWKANGEAERLFDEMEKDSKAYSAMIAGAAKFQDFERAMQLFEEMRSKSLIPTVEAYNYLISVVSLMKERGEAASEYILYLLGNMKKDGLRPDLYTMNSILEALTRKRFRKVNEMALSVLAEMKNLDIEPSLGTYSMLLSLFCDDFEYNTGNIGILYSIIDQIEGKEHTCRHPLDVTFFTTAMDKCYKYAHDKELAYRINKIVEFGNNSKLLGHAISESIYFKNFLRLLCETEDFEKFIEIYSQYVPNIYTPEPMLMDDILESLKFSGHFKYLPQLCTDVYAFEHSERENIISKILEMAGSMKHEKKIQTELVEVIWKIVDKINVRIQGGRFNFVWTGQLLGNALNTFVNGKDMEKSWSVMKHLAKNEEKVVGPPSKESLLNFCDLFLQEREYEKVEFCIKYAKGEYYPDFLNDFKSYTDNMFKETKLEQKHRMYIDGILQNVSLYSSETFSDASSTTKSTTAEDLEESEYSSSSSDEEESSSSSDEEDNK